MDKTYEGRRGPEGLSVFVAEHELGTAGSRRLSSRIDLINHTPAGAFECGFRGSGSSQLALAILADYLESDAEAIELHLGFRDRAIVGLPRDRDWRLTKKIIDTHVSALRASREL